MESVFENKVDCCGCAACKQICPKHCIEMVEDEYGYIYPQIDQSACIDCKACQNVCPLKNDVEKNEPIDVLAYLHPDEDYRLKSASSGVFETICRAFVGDDKYVVFGSEIDENLIVHHSSATNMDELQKLKKSKYLQSRIDTQFVEIREALKQGKKVVFTGTPCQNYALKKFLKKDYDNLLLVDFVCHGVPNQKIFLSYINYLEKKEKSRVVKYNFRNKRKFGDRWTNLGISVEFENGKKIESEANDDLYMRGFLGGIFNRESCYECKFATTGRVSDITMGDFWGIGEVYPELDEVYTNGTSLALVNTQKGAKVFEKISRKDLYRTELENAVKINGQLKYPQHMSPRRDLFLKSFLQGKDYKKCMKKACPELFKFKKEDIYELRAYIWLSSLKDKLLKR